MAENRYRLSFTTGGLLVDEAVRVASVVLSGGDASGAWTVAVERNLVQQRTRASTVRVTREVFQRVSELPESGLRVVAEGPGAQSRILLWIAACSRYRLLREFGRDVLRDRLVAGRELVQPDDFDTYWNVQSAWVDKLRDAAPSTREKLRQNTFRMVREAGFVGDGGRVVAASPSSEVAEVIGCIDPALALSLPLYDGQLAAFGAGDPATGAIRG